jgi:hypothetical protein
MPNIVFFCLRNINARYRDETEYYDDHIFPKIKKKEEKTHNKMSIKKK